MIRKFKVGNETLEFEMTNKTIFDIDERFDNYADVINGVMGGQNLYNNALKMMTCCCISKREDSEGNDKPLTTDELIEKLTPDQIMQELVDFVTNLYFDYRGIKRMDTDEKSDKNEDKKK